MSDRTHIIYSAADIEKYLLGELSPMQMHAMEKAALDDPFLTEAMEGYEGMKGRSWKNELAAMHEKIAEKGVTAKVIPLHKSKNEWWKRAAAAVIIIGAGTTLTYIFKEDKTVAEADKKHIAQTVATVNDSSVNYPPNEADSGNTVTFSVNPNASSTNEDRAINIPVAAKPRSSGTTDGLTSYPDAAMLQRTEVNAISADDAESKNAIASAPVNNATARNNGLSPEEAQIESRKLVSKAANEKSAQRSEGFVGNKSEAAINNFFTAQVVAADNSPLPFSNISIRKENFGTYADASGMVRLVSTDSVLTVEVKSVGYQPKTYMLRNNQGQAKIVLQEEEFAAKDKKVIGNMSAVSAQRSRRATLLIDSVVNVEPADGWENYRTYVANNLDIPDEMLKRGIKGELELTFDVKKNGTISNIRVNKSMGAAYDEAAKRLLMQGPQWKVKKGKKTSAVVKLQF